MRRAGVGIACLGLAVLAALLARDVWHVEKALRDGDARAATAPVDRRSWEAAQTLPFGVAEHLLASEDDVAFRALLARATRLARNVEPGPDAARGRAPVEAALARIEKGDQDTSRAAQAALLLGVLVFSDPEDPYNRVETPSEKAGARFRAALILDPALDEAKRNLELMLQEEREQKQEGPQSRAGGNRGGQGGAGLAPAGGGY